MQVASYLKLSIAVALATIALKFGAWWLTGSVGLLSDAMESFVNLAGAMFALLMVTIAAAPPDADHPYGHHKAEYFSSAFEGLLIIVAAVAILWAAGLRFVNPRPLEAVGIGVALSAVSAALNGALAWAMLRKAREHRSMALEGDARHLFTDVYTSIGVIAARDRGAAHRLAVAGSGDRGGGGRQHRARRREAGVGIGRRADGPCTRTRGAGGDPAHAQ